jgi:hypothetical protein
MKTVEMSEATGSNMLRCPGTVSGPLEQSPARSKTLQSARRHSNPLEDATADFQSVFSRRRVFFPFKHCFLGKNTLKNDQQGVFWLQTLFEPKKHSTNGKNTLRANWSAFHEPNR